jgi:hypothetical protein
MSSAISYKGQEQERVHHHRYGAGARPAGRDARVDVRHEHHHHYGLTNADQHHESRVQQGHHQPHHTTSTRVRTRDGKVHEHNHKYYVHKQDH